MKVAYIDLYILHYIYIFSDKSKYIIFSSDGCTDVYIEVSFFIHSSLIETVLGNSDS